MTLSKNTFRQICLKKIQNTAKHNLLYKSALVNKKLSTLLKQKKRSKILFYYPLEFEANILKSMNFLRKHNEIFIPFMEGESFKMVPFRLPLKKKKFGIFEAGNTNRNIKKIDIVIVPAVGVDGKLQRIGFGKGMYDRFFEKLQKRPYIIFTQLEFCYTKEFICDSHDVACDLLITPKKDVIKAIRIKK